MILLDEVVFVKTTFLFVHRLCIHVFSLRSAALLVCYIPLYYIFFFIYFLSK